MCKVTGQKVKIAGHERKIMTPWVAGAVEESWSSMLATPDSIWDSYQSVRLLITVMRGPAINNVLGSCQWKINMVPVWTLRATHGLYCIKLKHAETDWIYQSPLGRLSRPPQAEQAVLSDCHQTHHLISLAVQNNDSKTWRPIRLSPCLLKILC